MTSFANAFWGGGDYAAGLGVLFGKLQQGVQENQQLLTIARMRAEAEDLYGTRLGDIDHATNRIAGGFQRDDGASIRKAYEGVRTEMSEAAKNHRKIASNIRELVVSPFGRWCDQHAVRVQNSQDDLQMRLRAYDKQAETVRTCRSQYYNKCRKVEDLDEEEKLAFQDPRNELTSPKSATVPTVKLSEPDAPDEDEDPVDLGDETYGPERLKKVLTQMLETVRLGEVKIQILGTYSNVSTGAEITECIQKYMDGTTVALSERIGQDLISNGFLRLIGNVGNTFANSTRMNYQWRSKAFQVTGIPEKKQGLGRSPTAASEGSFMDNPSVGAVGEILQGWNPLNNQYPNETPAEKLRREARESDERYKAAVKKLDSLRCSLEEAMIDHLRFMERCELDRLKAIKSVILDFSGAVSNVIPSLQSTVDNMMLFHETIQPAADLRWVMENYRTGSFAPKVTVYENYYNQVGDQIFGVDIEARARSDRKRIPIIVTSLLTFLDNKYPELEGDEARRGIWLVDVPLAATHHLRSAIESAHAAPFEMLDRYDVPIAASVLKLYLLELPDSLVSSSVYEIVKTIYTTTAQSTDESTRISVIQSTLGQLRLANIATLDAITTHFTRLIELTSADEGYTATLATNLAPCILRPKQENSLTVTEKFNVRLVKDLFAHKDAIFGELKRASSLSNTQNRPRPPRDRTPSRDESGRREAMEERQRAIQASKERIRDRSPMRLPVNAAHGPSHGPSHGHRRDRSTSAETRFPIATNSNNNSPITTRTRGASLEVPNSPDHVVPSGGENVMNGHRFAPSAHNFSTPLPLRDAPDQTPARISTQSATVPRGRSDTETSNVSPPIQFSSSLNNPADYQPPNHFYNYGTEQDGPSVRSSIDSVSALTSQQQGRSSTESSHQPEVEKRNSLNRSSGVVRSTSKGPATRRPTGAGGAVDLRRQSLIVKSTGMAYEQQQQQQQQQPPPVMEERRGVELVDKPMDDD